MTIQTRYEIGDKILVGGKEYKIISALIYESGSKHTERYYLGNHTWITVCKKSKGKSLENR